MEEEFMEAIKIVKILLRFVVTGFNNDGQLRYCDCAKTSICDIMSSNLLAIHTLLCDIIIRFWNSNSDFIGIL